MYVYISLSLSLVDICLSNSTFLLFFYIPNILRNLKALYSAPMTRQKKKTPNISYGEFHMVCKRYDVKLIAFNYVAFLPLFILRCSWSNWTEHEDAVMWLRFKVNAGLFRLSRLSLTTLRNHWPHGNKWRLHSIVLLHSCSHLVDRSRLNILFTFLAAYLFFFFFL